MGERVDDTEEVPVALSSCVKDQRTEAGSEDFPRLTCKP